MLDENGIVYNEIDDLTIFVTNETKPNPFARDGATTKKNLPELIEYGHGYKGYLYDYPGSPYSEPRPFTANTIEDLEKHGQHIDALRKGLKKRGFTVT
jgi:hypothetical protein